MRIVAHALALALTLVPCVSNAAEAAQHPQRECSAGYAAVKKGAYQDAITPLQACTSANSFLTARGATAKYLLSVAYFYLGRYRDAYNESTILVPSAKQYLTADKYDFIISVILGSVEPEESLMTVDTQINPLLSEREQPRTCTAYDPQPCSSGRNSLGPEQANTAMREFFLGPPLKLKEQVDVSKLIAPLPDKF